MPRGALIVLATSGIVLITAAKTSRVAGNGILWDIESSGWWIWWISPGSLIADGWVITTTVVAFSTCAIDSIATA
jgi:hypothetical protein